jgi:hypothetical protein
LRLPGVIGKIMPILFRSIGLGSAFPNSEERNRFGIPWNSEIAQFNAIPYAIQGRANHGEAEQLTNGTKQG